MFYIVKEMRSEPTAQIARDLDRDYEAVLNYVHKVQDVSGDIDEFDLYDVCEADEVYVTAGEKGLEDENGSPRSRGLKKGRGTFASDKPPVLTLVRRDDGRVQFSSVRIYKRPTRTSPNTATEASSSVPTATRSTRTLKRRRGGRPSGRHPLRDLRHR